MNSLKDKVKNLTNKPGCYWYINSNQQIIYVGKAKNINKRVSQYFLSNINNKTRKMINEAIDINFYVTNNELEALIFEHNFIKEYSPKYNILLNDDKTYPYISIVGKNDPYYKYSRKKIKNAIYNFGPLPDGSKAIQLIKIFQRIFPLYRCLNKSEKPCNYYLLDMCSGACFKKVDQNFYKDNIKNVKKFFDGESDFLINKLKDKMQSLAKNLQFEDANKYKQLIFSIENLIKPQFVDLNNENISLDLFDYLYDNNTLYCIVIFFRNGQISLKNHEVFMDVDISEVEDIFTHFIMTIYDFNSIGNVISIPEEKINNSLKLLYNKKIDFEIYSKLFEISTTNLLELSKTKNIILQKDLTKQQALLKLKSILDFKNDIYKIEIFDIANYGSDTVIGGCCVFKNGVISKKDSRFYNLDNQIKGDVHLIKESVKKRLNSYQKTTKELLDLPDLIVIDGGKVQLDFAKQAINESKFNIPVCALQKDKNHKTEFLLYEDKKIEIKNDKVLYNFLSYMQTEVHNISVSKLNNKFNKNSLESILESLKGIGPQTVKKLYNHFKTTENIKKSSLEEITKIINSKTKANLIKNYLENII
ncbi:excinuclease ABC subunit UvrC [Spiroplasma endosymbiont of Anurida maritima]|uniref:excinuclease ABC subunit UvrC n=1 Tax=Spiroplasma endosymbiont of Anurida maritima TaxID=2967972 RepID=UPI0036D31F84